MKHTRKALLFVFALFLTAGVQVGCNTIDGAQEDVNYGIDKVQEIGE
ncbi:MAG: entericidin [Planctomycetota bacterium]